LQALNHKVMYMADWITKLDEFLKLSGREILTHAGSTSHEEATAKAEHEYEKFVQGRAALPSPVEVHFEQALKDLKQLERHQQAKPARANSTRGKKK